jgi:hypothetical protein
MGEKLSENELQLKILKNDTSRLSQKQYNEMRYLGSISSH